MTPRIMIKMEVSPASNTVKTQAEMLEPLNRGGGGLSASSRIRPGMAVFDCVAQFNQVRTGNQRIRREEGE